MGGSDSGQFYYLWVIDDIRMKMVEVVVVMSSSKARYLIIGGIELYFISLNGLI